MWADMNAFEKYALKKNLTRKLINRVSGNTFPTISSPSLNLSKPPENKLNALTNMLKNRTPLRTLSLGGNSLNVGLGKDFNKSLSGNLDFSIPTKQGGDSKFFATLTKRF